MISNFYRGDTKKYKIIIRNKDTGEPISVAGGKLTATLKTKVKDPNFVLQEIVNSTDSVPISGEILITFPASKTELLSPGTLQYDFEYINAAAEVTTILAGTVDVLYDITTPVT